MADRNVQTGSYASSSEGRLRGRALAPGRARGTLCVLSGDELGGGPAVAPAAPETEMQRFFREVDLLLKELRQHVEHLESRSMSDEADVVRAHVAMLRDREFHRRVRRAVHGARRSAEAAVEEVLAEIAEVVAGADDAVLPERAGDFRDLAAQLRARLSGDTLQIEREIEGVANPIVAAAELLPSMVLKAHALGVRGFVVSQGTGMSHGAILAKSFGLPVLRLPDLDALPADAAEVLLDAGREELIFNPDAYPAVEATADEQPLPDADKLPARLWLSIVDAAQTDQAEWGLARGVGLYRTEALFMQHVVDFPGEREQFRVYRRLFEACGERPVVVRTADLGADKPVAHMSFGPQLNPYLGMRAHRVFRYHPEILVTQVRAILRAAAGDHHLRLMFPMLETIEQWRFVEGLVSQAIESLRAEDAEYQREFETGVLIETPSAAWAFADFLEVADFASVGTNDLVQYFFAAERDAVNISQIYQPVHPTMLRLLKSLSDQARQAHKPLSICGEIAAEAEVLPLLVGLGLRDLSVSPARVRDLARDLARVDLDDCRVLAEQCLAMQTAAEVRARLGLPAEPTEIEVDETLPEGHTVDPVCGMILHVETSEFTEAHDGREYHFCSARCRRRFRLATAREENHVIDGNDAASRSR